MNLADFGMIPYTNHHLQTCSSDKLSKYWVSHVLHLNRWPVCVFCIHLLAIISQKGPQQLLQPFLSIKWPKHLSSCSHPGTTCRPTAGLARYRPASPSWGRGVDDHPRTFFGVTRQTVGSNGQFLIPHQNGGYDKNGIVRNCEDICIWLIFDGPLQNLVYLPMYL